jgi:hypothetical protein
MLPELVRFETSRKSVAALSTALTNQTIEASNMATQKASERVCTTCNILKPIDRFAPRNERPGCVVSKCRDCERIRKRNWRESEHGKLVRKQYNDRKKAEDPEGFARMRRDAAARYGVKHREILAARSANRRKANPEAHLAKVIAWQKRNPEYRLKSRLKMMYGTTLEAYYAMLQAQGGKCALCEVFLSATGATGPHVDHSHTTGKIRGLLCGRCNRALGLFKENHEALAKASQYVLRHLIADAERIA